MLRRGRQRCIVTQINLMVFPLAFMLFFIVAEMFVLQWQGRGSEYSWKDTILNLNSGHVVLWLFRGFEVFAFGWVASHWSLGVISSWPTVWQWVFGFIVWDFCFYVLHYTHHKIGLLWAIHEVHHEGRYFNVSLGARNSWYSSLSSVPFFIWMAFLGLPVEIFLVVSTFHYGVQLFNHNAVTPRTPWLETFMVTPNHHRVHHGDHPVYHDTNFGGTFLVWDKLFGTYKTALPEYPLSYGVTGHDASTNPVHTNHDPLRRWLRKPVLPRSDMTVEWPAWVIATAGVGLFLVVLLYVAGDGYWTAGQQYSIFALLVLGTVAIGGLSEGRNWARWGWFAVVAGLAIWVIGILAWHQWYWWLCLGGLGLHALWVLLHRPLPTASQ